MLTHEPNYIKSPYLCHICGSTYQRGSALSKHLRTFHKLTVPHGFTRFQFKKCQDKMYRLETQRVLSDELKHELAQQEAQSAGPSHHSSDYGGSSVDECQSYDNLWSVFKKRFKTFLEIGALNWCFESHLDGVNLAVSVEPPFKCLSFISKARIFQCVHNFIQFSFDFFVNPFTFCA